MTTLAIWHQSIGRKVTSIALPRIPIKLAFWLLAVGCVALLVSYILLINGLTHGAYAIKNSTREMERAAEQNRLLQAQYAEMNFLETAIEKARALNFEKTAKVQYVQLLDPALAVVNNQ